jgi:hypothetical protein
MTSFNCAVGMISTGMSGVTLSQPIQSFVQDGRSGPPVMLLARVLSWRVMRPAYPKIPLRPSSVVEAPSIRLVGLVRLAGPLPTTLPELQHDFHSCC